MLEKSILIRHLRFWTRCLILVILVLAMGYFAQYQWNLSFRQDMPGFFTATDPVSQKLTEIKELEEKITALFGRHQALAVINQGLVFYEIIAAFSSHVNEQTWIDAVSIVRNENQKNRSTLSCEGYSMNHQTLGLFLDQISADPDFEQVVLAQADSQDSIDTKFPGMVGFRLSCTVLRSAQDGPSN